jgi:hypothetical protein
MRPQSVVALLPWLAVALSCDLTGPPNPSRALAMPACGPADAPVTLIVFANGSAPSTAPYVSVQIAVAAHQLEGRTWRVVGSDTASAWYVEGTDRYEAATAGQVTITRVGPDNTIKGGTDITFPSLRFAGDFTASWVNNGVTCP